MSEVLEVKVRKSCRKQDGHRLGSCLSLTPCARRFIQDQSIRNQQGKSSFIAIFEDMKASHPKLDPRETTRCDLQPALPSGNKATNFSRTSSRQGIEVCLSRSLAANTWVLRQRSSSPQLTRCFNVTDDRPTFATETSNVSSSPKRDGTEKSHDK